MRAKRFVELLKGSGRLVAGRKKAFVAVSLALTGSSAMAGSTSADSDDGCGHGSYLAGDTCIEYCPDINEYYSKW
jgi:hypothetical protein